MRRETLSNCMAGDSIDLVQGRWLIAELQPHFLERRRRVFCATCCLCDSRNNLAVSATFRRSGNTSDSDLISQTSCFADIPTILEYPIGFGSEPNALTKSALSATLCCFSTTAIELECSGLSAKLCRFWRPFYAESDTFSQSIIAYFCSLDTPSSSFG
jgi:hypothetical protein